MRNLIYNQRDIPKDRLRYGLRASAGTGCGWIAVYNALELLGGHVEPRALIGCMERQLPLINGNLGTAFWSPALMFARWGFETKTFFLRRQFDEAAAAAQASVLFYRWHSRGRVGAHFVALEHTQRGFVGYNTYRNSTGPDFYGESLSEFLRQKGYFGAILITVTRR